MIRRAGAAVVLGAVLLSSCGDDGGAVAEPGRTVPAGFDAAIELEVVDGELVSGPREVDLRVGDHVKVVLTGNSDDQVHFHAYDLYIDPVDGVGELVFDAIIPGTFEVELEGSGRLLFEMTVS